MENQQPATTTNLPVLAPAEELKKKLPELLESNLPKLIKWHNKADAALDEIPEKINNDEEAEDVNATLAAVRDVYKAVNEKRTEITEVTDKLKNMLMEYERPFNPQNDKSKYNEKRKVLERYQQEKHDKIQREKAEAAKRKEAENFKIDLRAKMLTNLSDMLALAIQKSDTASREFFEKCTLETFDASANTYKSMKIQLKEKLYDECFICPDDMMAKAKELLAGGDFSSIVAALQAEEPYDKWNNAFVEKAAPIVNEWRAKIPDLKAELVAVAEASKKSQAEADALKAKQKEEADRKAKERQDKLDQEAKEQKAKIEEEAGMNKMSNEFAAQALTQELPDAGKTKLVLKFSDPKSTPKGFMEILYHCMSHKDFPGFQKRDAKTKKLVVDDKGRPEYIVPVQWWIDWFLENCNADISGAIITEDAKITVRK